MEDHRVLLNFIGKIKLKPGQEIWSLSMREVRNLQFADPALTAVDYLRKMLPGYEVEEDLFQFVI